MAPFLLLLSILLPAIQAADPPNLINNNQNRLAPQAKGIQVQTPVRVLDIPDTKDAQIVRENGRLRVEVKADTNGFKPDRFNSPELVKINTQTAIKHINVTELDGVRPKGIFSSFQPRPAPPTDFLPVDKTNATDKGGSIFGTDDRRLFQDTNYPWGTTGKFRKQGGWCSGTMVGPRHVLTASHCPTWNSDGTIGWATFTPGYFDGSGYVGEINIVRFVFWEKAPPFLTDQESAFDYVIGILDQDLTNNVGYVGYRTYDDHWNDGAYWEYIGYPSELSSGERPAYQGSCKISSKNDFSLSGQTGSLLGHFNEFTPGQSGGAAWGWWANEVFPRVVGVGSTIGDTVVKTTQNQDTDNEYGGGPALSALISYARDNWK